MSVEFTCGDPAGLAGYLYDECEPGERAAVETHLAACASCASELRALGATRSALASWAPPDAKLGFRVTSADEATDGVDEGTRNVLRPFDSAQGRPARWWQRPLPAWAQAAAAIVIFAAGLGLGLRTGGEGADVASSAVPVTAPRANATTVSVRDLEALERKLRAEMTALRATAVAAQRGEPAQRADSARTQASANEDAVLQRVRTLLAESEERQQRELALRLSQVVRDVDTQRRMDLMRIEQTFGQMEGFTQPELANQRQMLNYLIQRTGGRPQQ